MVAIGRALLVVNPAARRGVAARAGVEQAFAGAGVRCTVHETRGPGDAHDAARALGPGHDAVFSLGGDGTAMEVLRALAGSGQPVGILPGGTGNLVACALGTPMRAPAAVRALLQGEVRSIDLGRLGDGQVFAFAAGVGVDATMIARTRPAAKRRFGVLAYVVSGVRATLAFDRFPVEVIVDEKRHMFEAVSLMVANFGHVLHGLITLGPGVRADDGALDVCVYSPRGALDAVRVGWRLMRGDFRPDAAMHFVRGQRIEIRVPAGRARQADGELLPEGPFRIDVVPRAASVLVAARRRGRPKGAAGD